MGVDIATLGIEIKPVGIDVANKELDTLSSTSKKAEAAAGTLGKSFDTLTGYIKGAAAALGLYKLAEMIKDVSLMAARYETLGVVMGVVGNNAGYTAKQMADFSQGLQKNGIAMMESRQVLTQMAQAHIDLAKSQELSRIAQDAATIGGINSSEAFERMINGIQRGETEILKTIGLNVNFEDAYKKLALQVGKTTEQLTETEKVQGRVNAVMERGKDIAGTYEAAMGTAGKQITSMKRYMDNLKVVSGEIFQDALIMLVQGFTGALKEANTEAEKLAEQNKIKQWGEDIVKVMAFVADALRYSLALVGTFTGTAIAGLMQMYKVGEALVNLVKGNLSAAGGNISEALAVGQAWSDDMKKKWGGVSFQESANKMYGDRAANAAGEKAKKEAAEQLRLTEGAARREKEAATEAAKKGERDYLDNLKNTLAIVKDHITLMNELGKARLEFSGQRYNDALKEQTDLYTQGKVSLSALIGPLQEYNNTLKEIFDARSSQGQDGLQKTLDQLELFNQKVKNTSSKEAKTARVEILNAYKDTASQILEVEQSRYKTLLDGERQYANKMYEIMKAKQKEIQDLKQSFTDANKAFEEARRKDTGDYSGSGAYLDPNLDALAKRQAMIAKLRSDEEEINRITDPATRNKKLQDQITAWEQLAVQVDATTTKTRTFTDTSQAFSSTGFLPEITETITSVNTLITKDEAYRQVMAERQRLQEKIIASMENERLAAANAYESSIAKITAYQAKLVEVENLLAQTKIFKIDFQSNADSVISKLQDMVRIANSMPSSGGYMPVNTNTSSSTSTAPQSQMIQTGTSLSFGGITINTQATDAKQLSRDLFPSLMDTGSQYGFAFQP